MTIQYSIVTELASRLTNIKTANGYNSNLSDSNIYIGRRNPYEDNEPAARILFGGESPAETVAAQRYSGRQTRDLSVAIEYILPLGSMDSIEVAIMAGADIWAAINRATTAPGITDEVSFNLGGLVPRLQYLTFIEVLIEQQSNFGGAQIEISTAYNVNLRDPFTAIP